MPPCRRLRRQLAALQSSAAAPPTPPPLALPLEAIEPEREVDGAALQYQRSGYTIVRDIVPAPLLRELQGRFEEHTADYHREHGEQGRFELEALREDEVFGRLATLLTEHPVVRRTRRGCAGRSSTTSPTAASTTAALPPTAAGTRILKARSRAAAPSRGTRQSGPVRSGRTSGASGRSGAGSS